jgi:hypothetical protein
MKQETNVAPVDSAVTGLQASAPCDQADSKTRVEDVNLVS